MRYKIDRESKQNEGLVVITCINDDNSIYCKELVKKNNTDLYDDVAKGNKLELDDSFIEDFSIGECRTYIKKYYPNKKINDIGLIISAKNAFFYGETSFSFSKTILGNSEIVRGTTFSGTADFRYTIFSGAADFSYIKFLGEVLFHRTTFSGAVDFSYTAFSGNVGFRRTGFSGEANFSCTTFSKAAGFNSTTFSGLAHFRSTTFSGAAHFSSTTFSAADFHSATFSAADFSSTTFSEAAFFSYTTFSRAAYFRSTTFSGVADFSYITFSLVADFSYITFSGEVLKLDLTGCFIERNLFVFNSGIKIILTNLNIRGDIIIEKLNEKIITSQGCTYKEKADQFILLKTNLNKQGKYDDEDKMYYEYKKCMRESKLRGEGINNNKKAKKILNYIWQGIWYLPKLVLFELIGGYGTKPKNVFLTMLLTIIGFAAAYLYIPGLKIDISNSSISNNIIACIYYSGITFLTVGYGDIKPDNDITAMVSVTEGFLGIFLMSYFTVSFVRKLLR